MVDEKFIRKVLGFDKGATEEQVKDAYISLFNSPAGETVLEDLAKKCGQFGFSFTPGDPHGTSYNEGQRNIFCYILGRSLKLFDEKRQEVANTVPK